MQRAIRVSNWLVIILAATVLAVAAEAAPKLRVVATTPDLRSLAEAVGGELIEAVNLIPAGIDHEAFEPHPADLLKLRGAAAMVRVGLGYDHWLDKLLHENGDPALMRGGAGYIDASLGIPLLELRGRSAAPQDGHAHGVGNPHYWLDPTNAETITAAIAEGLIGVAPGLGEQFIDHRRQFLAALSERMAAWESTLAPHAGAAIVVYHNSWPYLARRFRLNVVGIIEQKEGVAPSPAHLARLVRIIGEARVRVIVREPFEPDDAPRLLARRTGAQVRVLAPSVGSLAEAADYLSLFDYNVRQLARGLAAAGE